MLVRALQSLWQHPVVQSMLANSLFGARIVFPDNDMEYQFCVIVQHNGAVGNPRTGWRLQPAQC